CASARRASVAACRSTAPRAPAPASNCCCPTPPTVETRSLLPTSAPPVSPPVPGRLGAGHPVVQALVADALNGGPPLMALHLDIDHFASVNEIGRAHV